jgi:general secretion pathway protein M
MTALLRAWLERQSPRERRLLGGAASVLMLALVWWALVAPALQTYRQSSSAHAKLELQIAQMQSLAAEAAKLRAVPRANSAQVQAWLDGATKKLGKASVAMQGGRVQVSFAGASPEALAAWLAEARIKAQLVPLEAHWKKNASLLWDGSLVFELNP